MNRNAEIKRIVRKLFVKFLLLQLAILGFSVLLSKGSAAYFKQRLAGQLSAASRDALLSGDARRAITDLGPAAARDFTGLAWAPAGAEGAFRLPAGWTGCAGFACARTTVRIWFDDGGEFPAGELTFFYPRWTPALYGLGGWLLIFLLSLPLAFQERRRLIREYDLLVEYRVKESYSTLAAQVAHDIRSPLAALAAATRGLGLPGEQRTLIDGAVGRIQGIADDLLARYRSPGAEAKAKVETCVLAGLIEQVVAEKRIQHKDKPGVAIEFSGGAGIKAAVDQREFQRIVSNLVNNAVEAFENGGTVSVSLAAADGRVLVKVRDDGKGIPPELLARLGRKGETHGKAGGTGLGLYHARLSAESWGGALSVESEPGKGTAVTLSLPAAAKPAAGLRAVLLDDDPLVHMNWKMAARAAGAELVSCRTGEELEAAAGTLPRDIPVFIDSELGGEVRGEDIARTLHEKGFSDLTMATGHDPSRFAHLPWLKVAGKEPPWS